MVRMDEGADGCKIRVGLMVNTQVNNQTNTQRRIQADIPGSVQAKAGRTAAVILAAGSGTRMGGDVKKQFLLLKDKPILYYSLKAFEESFVNEIILVTSADEIEYCKKEIVERYGFHKVSSIVPGGKERYHSVYAGLAVLKEKRVYEHGGYVLIHDGARPFADETIINNAMAGAVQYGACVIGMPVKDTIKIADSDGFAKMTPKRSDTWMIQTPQAFSYQLIRDAYDKLMGSDAYQAGITDDAMVVETMTECPVKLTEGSYENIKVTTPEDMELAAAILNRRRG